MFRTKDYNLKKIKAKNYVIEFDYPKNKKSHLPKELYIETKSFLIKLNGKQINSLQKILIKFI